MSVFPAGFSAALTQPRDNQGKCMECGRLRVSTSFASEVSGFLRQFSNLYYWTNVDAFRNEAFKERYGGKKENIIFSCGK